MNIPTEINILTPYSIEFLLEGLLSCVITLNDFSVIGLRAGEERRASSMSEARDSSMHCRWCGEFCKTSRRTSSPEVLDELLLEVSDGRLSRRSFASNTYTIFKITIITFIHIGKVD